MTSIFICSDLHFTHHRDGGDAFLKTLPNYVDLAIIAGDLSSGNGLKEAIKRVCAYFNHVIYVAGNHCYYGSTFYDTDFLLSDLDNNISNFTWLENKRAVVKGITFIGATLWFPNSAIAQAYKYHLNDFRYIASCDPEAFTRYSSSVKYLENNIQPDDIVITHHLPTYKSISPKFVGSLLNCFFASDLDWMIEKRNPSIWIHGHVHDPVNYYIKNTHIVCNPLGYPNENASFDKNFIIHV